MCTKHKKWCSKEKEESWCQEQKYANDMALPLHMESLSKHTKIRQFPLPKLELTSPESMEIPALRHLQAYLKCAATGLWIPAHR